MPRRRKTKVAATRKKAAVLPEGEEGADLSQDERINKVDTFVKDFDMQLEHHIKDVESEIKRYLDALDHSFSRQCTFLKPLLNLPLHSFLKGPGVEDALAMVDSGSDEIESMINAKFNLNVAAKPRPKKNEMDTIVEEETDDQPMETSRQAGARRTRRAAAASTRKGAARKPGKFTTPHGAKPSIASIADTPLFTPQFNPRLPKTPAVTAGKSQRSFATISNTGSPHLLAANEIGIGFGGDKGITLRSDEDLAEHVDWADHDIVQKLKTLYQKLGNALVAQKKNCDA